MPNAYDLTEVVSQLLNNRVQDRVLLLKYFQEAMVYNKALQALVMKLMETAVDKKLNPSELMMLGLRHGMLVGVLLERDIQQRKVH